jgi:hypothetical protein
MARLRSGVLAAWTTAWLSGRAAFDDVLHATAGDDRAHQLLPVGGSADVLPEALSQALIAWRGTADEVRLVLPVAGDVRGMPGPREFLDAALVAGEAVYGGPVGLVPGITSYAVTSAPTTVLWRAFAVEEPKPDHLAVSEAQHDLTEAIRESASALAGAGVARWFADVSEQLSRARRAGEELDLPPGFPPRAVALIAQAERLQAVLDIAAQDPTGAAIDRGGIQARDEALRPLALAVRRARVAGYNAGTEY